MSTAPQDAALTARGLRVTRGRKALLRGVDIEARHGQVIGVLGPSGAGKSTLFQTLVGEVLPDSGTVTLLGRNVSDWPLWKRSRAGLGYIPQGPSILWDLSVAGNLKAFHSVAGVPSAGAGEAAARVGLEHRLHLRAGDLSAGERRRLEFARALTTNPRVLVCDEPFAGVDPVGAARLGDLLRDLAAGGAAVLLADHHVAEALRVCTDAVLLLDGAIAAAASAAEFPHLGIVRGRYLGTWTETP